VNSEDEKQTKLIKVGGIAAIAILAVILVSLKNSGALSELVADSKGPAGVDGATSENRSSREGRSSRKNLDGQESLMVDRFDPKIRRVIALLQNSELQRTTESRDISDERGSRFSYTIETPSIEERKRLLNEIKEVTGTTLNANREVIPWAEYLAHSYGLYDKYPRQVSLTNRNDEDIVRYLSTILITPEDVGDSLGGFVIIDEKANEPQSWRYSHLMSMEQDRDTPPSEMTGSELDP